MSIPEFPVDLDCIPDSGELFPAPIGTDPWVAYHGTSGVNAERIEREGLQQEHATITRSEIEAVVDIYQWMMWCGEDSGGYAILKPWSLEHDHRHGSSPLFFHDDSVRTLTFATSMMAGGEKVMAARLAITDLHRYLAEPAIREKHAKQMWNCVHPSIRSATPQERVKGLSNMSEQQRSCLIRQLDWTSVDLAELERRIQAVDHLCQRCRDCFERHSFGVVYAVRFKPSDVPTMRFNSSMGIQVFKSLNRSRIIARAVLTKENEEQWQDRFRTLQSPRAKAQLLSPPCDGLIARIKEHVQLHDLDGRHGTTNA